MNITPQLLELARRGDETAQAAIITRLLPGIRRVAADSTVPGLDSFTTALCIVAYWMLSRKYVEQWLVWLVVDAVTVGLYLYKGIPLTAGLYALYTGLAVAGYLRWLRMMRQVA